MEPVLLPGRTGRVRRDATSVFGAPCARTLLESHREDLDAGARLLVEKETLTPEEFAPLLPIKRAALALRRV